MSTNLLRTTLCPRFWLGSVFLGLLVSPQTAWAQTFSQPNFVLDPVYDGAGTTGLDFAHNRYMYVAEKQGRVLVFRPSANGYGAPQVFVDLRSQVDSSLESGLLGLAVDPDFANNRYLYVCYTTNNDQRVTRFTANASFTQGSDETVLVSGLPKNVTFHKAGDIRFRPGEPDHLYVALGDDDLADESQQLTSYRGKMLRINKSNGAGLMNNPYYQGGDLNTVRGRTWAIGFRNPFRITFHPNVPTPDVMYVSENGDSTDRLSWVRMGSNGAWNSRGDQAGFLNPPDPNHRVMYTDRASHIGVAIAAAGPFADGNHPVIYLSNWVHPAGGSISRFRLTGAELSNAVPVPADNGQRFVRSLSGTHLEFGPDGHLYFTTTGPDASSSDFFIGRIRFVGGTPPQASFDTNPDPASGNAPLQVTFTDTSNDPDGTISRRSWNFGDGDSSTDTSPTHTFQSPGTYNVVLTVTDDDNLSDTAMRQVVVSNQTNLTLSGRIYDGRTLDGSPLGVATRLRLYREDAQTPLSFPGGQGPDGNEIAIASGGEIDTTISVEVPGSAVVITAGEDTAELQFARAGFAVSGATHRQELSFYLASVAQRGRVLDSRNNPAQVDIGVARQTPADLYAMAGARDYLSSSGISASGVNHRIVSDSLGYYYLPLRDQGQYYIDAVADTNGDTYTSAAIEQMIGAAEVIDRDIMVGLQAGGASCDSLDAIAETPSVDYVTDIQPLWGFACTGCHKPNSANGGGLDLTPANSHQALASIMSSQVPGRALVEPGSAMTSYLMEKISCENPQIGTRMRPGSPMAPASQALVRDWINQGALLSPGAQPDAGMGSNDAGTTAGRDGGGISPRNGDAVGSAGCGCSTHRPSGDSWPAASFLMGIVLVVGMRRRKR